MLPVYATSHSKLKYGFGCSSQETWFPQNRLWEDFVSVGRMNVLGVGLNIYKGSDGVVVTECLRTDLCGALLLQIWGFECNL